MGNITTIFDLLDNWRHFPSYQLERRADIFFAVFLPDVIKKTFNSEVKTIIPEFPIRVGTIYPDKPINKSYKADYFVLTEGTNQCILVELKTDDTSRREEQDDYLTAAQEVKLHALIDGVISIYEATEYKQKYRSLINELISSGLLKEDGSDLVNCASDETEITILYIQPNPSENDDKKSISFAVYSEIVAEHEDELSLRFSKSLIEWANVKPGQQ
ncbi:MAG: hypothetical protein U9N80_04290 [Chloroflexota bacterium]|nr:hypothetical protein [Chloroflexota bacterium]